jgi:hypothetical protein
MFCYSAVSLRVTIDRQSHIRNVGRYCFRSFAMLNTLIFGSREACSANKPRCMACDDVTNCKEAWSIWGIVVDHNPEVRYQTHLETCIALIGIVRDLGDQHALIRDYPG